MNPTLNAFVPVDQEVYDDPRVRAQLELERSLELLLHAYPRRFGHITYAWVRLEEIGWPVGVPRDYGALVIEAEVLG